MSSHFFPPIIIPPSLKNTRLKTARAKEHLDAVNKVFDAFRESKPYFVVRENDFDKGEQLIKIEFQSAPKGIGLIVGDFVQCLRSALDHLAWQLALLTTAKPEKRTQFPIFLNSNPKDFQRFTKDVFPAAIPVIESLQPYCPNSTMGTYEYHPLWNLHELSNTDKHRVIAINYTFLHVAGPHGSQTSFTVLDDERLAKTYQEIRVPLSTKSKYQPNPEPILDITLGEPGGIEIPRQGLEAIYYFVSEEVIPRFVGFFP